jgi:mono/diheme cytochrome c family protein
LQCIGFADEAPSKIDYQEQIKSLLRERCFACHGPLRQEGGLRLDTREAMITGGDSGNALIPKEADKSLLLQRISSADIANRMPPEHEGEAMRSEQIDLLRRWIEMGAEGIAGEEPEPDPRAHWAFQAITKPQAPHSGEDGGKSPHPIDFFLADVYSKHQVEGLERASNEVLLRRLSFDLIGLPPTLEEYSQVPAEWDPQWYSQQVQRLLQDPRHGERWARHWMDVWRFSDWWGLGDQLRNSQLHMWHWRDWIIENLNADRPYDTMVQMMLAADEISPEDFGDLRATGFLARNYFLFNRNQWMDETIEHVRQ